MFHRLIFTLNTNYLVCEFQGSENWGLKSSISATNYNSNHPNYKPQHGMDGKWNTDSATSKKMNSC